MPHIIIEHSANLAELTDIGELVEAVHAAALDDGLPALDALRTRAVSRQHYRIADGNPAYGFVYLTARIGPGREPASVERFLARLMDTVDEALAPLLPDNPVALSAEIQFIEPSQRIMRNHIRTHLDQADGS